jgi:hypothetical protein
MDLQYGSPISAVFFSFLVLFFRYKYFPQHQCFETPSSYNISIDKVGKSKHNKTLFKYRIQNDVLTIKGPKHVVFLLTPIS